ncbi:MAG: hypothetical protein FWH26_04310 [Oscillospiraceae bacterium]|nr:hypothetical protein [Oscillospiraceae bacterium]
MRRTKRTARICRAAVLLAALLCLSARAAPLDECDAGRHQYAETRRTAPTAMEDGQVEYTCGVCGHQYADTIFATDHLWGGWVTDKQASCTEAGERHRTCTRDQSHDQYADIPALGHDYIESVTAPDCERAGVKTFACSRCGDKYTERIDPIGHDYKKAEAIELSCVEPGKIIFVCANDPAHSYEESIPAIGSHDFGEWQPETPAREGTEGLETRECARCGLVEPRTLEALSVPGIQPPAAAPAEPPDTLPVMDIVLVGANAVSLSFFAFLLTPYFLCLIYIRRRRRIVEERDALRKEVDVLYGYE